jgi:hypothetical protein
MRTLVITLALAAAMLCPGSATWQVQAAGMAGAAQLSTAVKAASPIQPAACRGWGSRCPPGYFWNGYRCLPC